MLCEKYWEEGGGYHQPVSFDDLLLYWKVIGIEVD